MKPYRIYDHSCAAQLIKIRNIKRKGIRFDNDSLEEAIESIKRLEELSRNNTQYVVLHYSDLYSARIVYVHEIRERDSV